MKAIDFHVHLPLKEHNEFLGDLLEPAKKYFNIDIEVKDTKEVLDYMSSLGIERVVVLPIDCSTNLGRKIPNESVLSIKDDRVIKFVSVDPLKTNSLEELRSLLSNSEVFGVKFHPIAQNFHPLDERALRLYRLIDDKGLIALFHTGFTGIGAGIRTNFRLDYGRPIY
ncbi:MAG: amidohydrolase family protein, partial [Sulfolobaceae archaeon]